MLSAKEIIEIRSNPAIEIPSFGVKDFRPDGSLQQPSEIENSLLEIKSLISHERIKLLGTLSQAVWQDELQLAEVTHQIGSYWTYMGHKIRQKLYIYPEEVLYLLEAGTLQLIYNEVPLSVQRAYFVVFNKKNKITLEKYHVYSILTNCGYKVLRHSLENTVSKYEKQLEVHKIGLKLKDYNSKKRHQDDPQEISKKLKIDEIKSFPIEIDDYKMSQEIEYCNNNSDTNLNFDYDVYSETTEKSFKKTCLQLPNFRVIIHRGEDSIPDVEEFYKISNIYKDEVPVIHGIVFFDCVAFYKLDPVNLPNV